MILLKSSVINICFLKSFLLARWTNMFNGIQIFDFLFRQTISTECSKLFQSSYEIWFFQDKPSEMFGKADISKWYLAWLTMETLRMKTFL